MKGIGLTFIDAVLELTEGRGGRFRRTATGTLAYTPGGNEPHTILPFSRTGLPMAPKSHDLPAHDRPLTFLNESTLAELRQHSLNRKLDLDQDLWPLIEAELQFQYCRANMNTAEWQQKLDACGKDITQLHDLIEQFHHANPEADRFNYLSILDPAAGHAFPHGPAYATFIEQYLQAEIARAQLGQAGSPIKAAIEIWYDCRKALNHFLQFGGFNPPSHRKLIEHWFPLFKRVAFGPPIINIEKLLALTQAGLLDFSVARSPILSLDENNGRFRLTTLSATASADILIDARYPTVHIPQDAAPLYKNLYARKMIRPYENRDAASTYTPGAIDMTAAMRFIIDAHGQPNPDIAVTGIPTEGNLVGNLTMARDDFSAQWAAQTLAQLSLRETEPT